MEGDNGHNWEDYSVYGFDSNEQKDQFTQEVQNPAEANVYGPYDPQYEEQQYTENNDN